MREFFMQKQYDLKELVRLLNTLVLNKWHPEGREGNDGSAGNTLEDLLEVEENNLKIPDWGEFELKTKKVESQSLVTLLHREPLPGASVPKLLKGLGWKHAEAGLKYPRNEMSFRSTTRANAFSVRGFSILLDEEKISFVFNKEKVRGSEKDRTIGYDTYGDWLDDVLNRAEYDNAIFPIYWERAYIENEIRKKLDKTLFVTYKAKKIGGIKHFMYTDALLLSNFLPEKMEGLFNKNALYVDFDARTGHNHGTKFRVDVKYLKDLFEKSVSLT